MSCNRMIETRAAISLKISEIPQGLLEEMKAINEADAERSPSQK